MFARPSLTLPPMQNFYAHACERGSRLIRILICARAYIYMRKAIIMNYSHAHVM